MTAADEPEDGDMPALDHDHDVLLIAGSRPEAARLAPVATAFASTDRIRALTVASGPDPMAVHEAFEALGVPADITQLPSGPPPSHLAGIAATVLDRLDGLLVDLDPSAVLVHGGGMTALVAAQAAFWRQIPVVHLQSGVATDDLLCPFPQEANRRVIGQLASLFLTTDGAALGSPIGPNTIPVGDTFTANSAPADLRCARVVRRVRRGERRLVLVGLDRTDSLGVLAGLPDLLAHTDDIEVVVHGDLAAHGAAHPLLDHPRATVARHIPFADLIWLVSSASVLVSDDPQLVADAPALGTPAVLVDGPHVPEPGDSIRSVLSPRVMSTVRQILAAERAEPRRPRTAPADGLAAIRVEQAVAWMFGMCPTPHVTVPSQAGTSSPTGTSSPAGTSSPTGTEV